MSARNIIPFLERICLETAIFLISMLFWWIRGIILHCRHWSQVGTHKNATLDHEKISIQYALLISKYETSSNNFDFNFNVIDDSFMTCSGPCATTIAILNSFWLTYIHILWLTYYLWAVFFRTINRNDSYDTVEHLRLHQNWLLILNWHVYLTASMIFHVSWRSRDINILIEMLHEIDYWLLHH